MIRQLPGERSHRHRHTRTNIVAQSHRADEALPADAELLTHRAVDQLTVVVPTEHLKVQWAQAAQRHGLALDPRFSNTSPQTSPEYHGVMVTYAQVAWHPALHRVRTEQRKPWSSSMRSIMAVTPRLGATPFAKPSATRHADLP